MAGLLECLFSCDLENLKILLKNTDVNKAIPGTEGCTPLHVVAGVDSVRSKDNILAFLFENGADPNARSHENLTPVHIAAMWNKCYELEKLLQHGGNPWLTDIENKNSFDMAADNHCYEAYQLLNIYLAQDKFNFKPESKTLNEPKTISSSASSSVSETFDDSETEDFNATKNYTFMTANEDLPAMFFTSDDDSEDCLGDVSNFLKKKNISKYRYKKDLPEKNSSGTGTLCRQDEISEKKNINALEDKATDQLEKSENNFNSPFTFSSTFCDTSEISSSDLTDEDGYSKIIDSDHNSDIVLIETKIGNKLYTSNSHSTCSSASDWKAYQSFKSNCSSKTYCSSHSRVSLLPIPKEFEEYSNSKIFEELKKLGDNPGPVLDHTREVYLHRLMKIKSGCITCCELPKPKYCNELYLFLENKIDMKTIHMLEQNITEEFNEEIGKRWRGGNLKCCFNYFLLDPRVTQNLPERASDLSDEQAFLIFLDALFYVGKGSKGRPYHHLFEAAKFLENDQPKSDKVAHILDIWSSGLGVISLHRFHNAIPVEAFTREACIIEAVGLENLTNIKKGDFYGLCTRLTTYKKRLIGISLLYKAFHIFLLEGETSIKPKDIRNR